jgi:hypothetical protein
VHVLTRCLGMRLLTERVLSRAGYAQGGATSDHTSHAIIGDGPKALAEMIHE